jgi:hypothetical protein
MQDPYFALIGVDWYLFETGFVGACFDSLTVVAYLRLEKELMRPMIDAACFVSIA